jgi:hypothetical protein
MLPPVTLGTSDVARLGCFVASAEKDDDRPALPTKVDAVPGAVVDAQLQDTLPDRLAVAEVSRAKARDAGVDFLDCTKVFQRTEPFVERATAVGRRVDADFRL